jgi:hypothetical protein
MCKLITEDEAAVYVDLSGEPDYQLLRLAPSNLTAGTGLFLSDEHSAPRRAMIDSRWFSQMKSLRFKRRNLDGIGRIGYVLLGMFFGLLAALFLVLTAEGAFAQETHIDDGPVQHIEADVLNYGDSNAHADGEEDCTDHFNWDNDRYKAFTYQESDNVCADQYYVHFVGGEWVMITKEEFFQATCLVYFPEYPRSDWHHCDDVVKAMEEDEHIWNVDSLAISPLFYPMRGTEIKIADREWLSDLEIRYTTP